MKILWQKGGEGTIETCDGQAIVVLSTRSAPPGTPLVGALGSGTEIQVKVHGCKKQDGDPARFRIQGRLVNASRTLKSELDSITRP